MIEEMAMKQLVKLQKQASKQHMDAKLNLSRFQIVEL